MNIIRRDGITILWTCISDRLYLLIIICSPATNMVSQCMSNTSKLYCQSIGGIWIFNCQDVWIWCVLMLRDGITIWNVTESHVQITKHIICLQYQLLYRYYYYKSDVCRYEGGCNHLLIFLHYVHITTQRCWLLLFLITPYHNLNSYSKLDR